MQNKVVVVTGAAKGIGRQIAMSFVEAGAKTVICDVDQPALADTAEQLTAMGGDVLPLGVDVRNEAEVESMFERAAAAFGGVDILIANAAVVSHAHLWPDPVWGAPWPPVRDMSLEFWNRVFETNVTGLFLSCKHAIPHLERSGGGHIIHVQGGGRPHKLGTLAYGVSKRAADWFVTFLAEEVRAAGICAINVDPGGAIATEEAPDEVTAAGYPGLEIVGDRFVVAAQAPIEWSGRTLHVEAGVLEPMGW